VLNFGSGLERSTYANYEQAQECAWENFIVPSCRIFDDCLTKFLLVPDFAGGVSLQVGRDYSKVPALQEDEDAKAKRHIDLYSGGVIMRSEARAAMGFETTPEDEIYAPKGGLPVGAGLPPPPLAGLVPSNQKGVNYLLQRAGYVEYLAGLRKQKEREFSNGKDTAIIPSN